MSHFLFRRLAGMMELLWCITMVPVIYTRGRDNGGGIEGLCFADILSFRGIECCLVIWQ